MHQNVNKKRLSMLDSTHPRRSVKNAGKFSSINLFFDVDKHNLLIINGFSYWLKNDQSVSGRVIMGAEGGYLRIAHKLIHR